MKICVVGLGYVGLPLSISLAKYFKVIGFDINKEKIEELKSGYDRNNEVKKSDFEEVKDNIEFTTKESKIREADIIIVTVPTPITKDKKPDLSYLKDATKIIGRNLKKGAIVVYESTTYPGCTEEVCLPILEKESGLKLGEFNIGYSPERINPGDPEHTLDKITKIVAANDENTLRILSNIYEKVTNVYKVKSIQVAEAAKVIENIQRDLNIALFNELSIIFDKFGLDSKEIFDAAATKWNFLRFYPGFVGGHCIPVDPYYLTSKTMQLGYIPELILAGRRINEKIPSYVANKIVKLLIKNNKIVGEVRVLILGATYKDNVPDLRESKVKKLVKELKDFGINDITIYEPLIDKEFIFGVENKRPCGKYDIIIYALDHKNFMQIRESLFDYLKEDGIFIDIKRKFDKKYFKNKNIIYWGL